jgi:hypothetical protein
MGEGEPGTIGIADGMALGDATTPAGDGGGGTEGAFDGKGGGARVGTTGGGKGPTAGGFTLGGAKGVGVGLALTSPLKPPGVGVRLQPAITASISVTRSRVRMRHPLSIDGMPSVQAGLPPHPPYGHLLPQGRRNKEA